MALLDWIMPELDGPGVCREVRERKDHSYVYMILLTSKEKKEDVVAGLESGADDYLTKPFDPEELKARLRAGKRILDLEDRLIARWIRLSTPQRRGAKLRQTGRSKTANRKHAGVRA